MWTPGIQITRVPDGTKLRATLMGRIDLNGLNLCPPCETTLPFTVNRMDKGVPGVPATPRATTSTAPTSGPAEAPTAVPGVPGVPGSKEAKLKAIWHILETVALVDSIIISNVDQGSFDSFPSSKLPTENLTDLKASTATRKPHQGQLNSPVAQWDLSSLICLFQSGRLQRDQRFPRTH